MNNQLTAHTLTFVLAGGAGRRLRPLTTYRPKPLVPFGGCFRILDFTLSNCFNSGLDRVHVLTQHQGESITSYLRRGWSLGRAGKGEFAVACSSLRGRPYAGTADAILQNLPQFLEPRHLFALVVSADHVYKMDYVRLLGVHADSGADVTIATLDFPKEFSSEIGVVKVDKDNRVVAFEEKPRNGNTDFNDANTVQANMGVYVFNIETLKTVLQANGAQLQDIAGDLIPRLLQSHRVNAYRHEDCTDRKPLYWRDVGTLESYYRASMDLLLSNPPIDPYDKQWPVRPAGRQPLGQIALSGVGKEPGVNSVIPRATDIAGACVYSSVLSPGVVLESGVDVRHSVLLPGAIIKRGAAVRGAIIDAHVVVEAGDRVGYAQEKDHSRFHVASNGIVVVSPDHCSQETAREMFSG